VSGQLHAPAALPPGEKPPVPIGYEVGWTPEPVWTTWRRENSWPYRDSNSDLSVVQPVAKRARIKPKKILITRGKANVLLITILANVMRTTKPQAWYGWYTQHDTKRDKHKSLLHSTKFMTAPVYKLTVVQLVKNSASLLSVKVHRSQS
jgi:hypothetical protein